MPADGVLAEEAVEAEGIEVVVAGDAPGPFGFDLLVVLFVDAAVERLALEGAEGALLARGDEREKAEDGEERQGREGVDEAAIEDGGHASLGRQEVAVEE